MQTPNVVVQITMEHFAVCILFDFASIIKMWMPMRLEIEWEREKEWESEREIEIWMCGAGCWKCRRNVFCQVINLMNRKISLRRDNPPVFLRWRWHCGVGCHCYASAFCRQMIEFIITTGLIHTIFLLLSVDFWPRMNHLQGVTTSMHPRVTRMMSKTCKCRGAAWRSVVTSCVQYTVDDHPVNCIRTIWTVSAFRHDQVICHFICRAIGEIT